MRVAVSYSRHNVQRIYDFRSRVFNIHAKDAQREIETWAVQQGLPTTDDNVTRLLQLYDELSENFELGRVVGPDREQMGEFQERHAAIVAEVQRWGPQVLRRQFVELRGLFEGYMDQIPSCANVERGYF